VPRVVPGADVRWRCVGQGAARVCRRAAGAPFACNEAECIQPWPRVPDDGEWECFERAGAVVCRGGEPPAGAAPGLPDPGWICSDGRTRVCIDLAPDRPEAKEFATCAYQETGGGRLRQRCTKRDEPRIGAVCGACPRGSVCVEGVCLPTKRPEANCWFDAECGPGHACAFATCVTQ
jgi:hypothetical protein